VDEEGGADQPDAGRGGGTGLDGATAQGSELEEELVSPQPGMESAGTWSQPATAVAAVAAVGVSPQCKASAGGSGSGLDGAGAAWVSDSKSPQPDDAAAVDAGGSPHPKEAGRGGT